MSSTGKQELDAPSSSDVKSDDFVKYATVVDAIIKRHGTPGEVAPARRGIMVAQMFALLGATSSTQKEAVLDTLVVLCIMHGTSPNVKWDEVEFSPDGCKTITMEKIVDDIVRRKYFRKFMTGYAERAIRLYNSSSMLVKILSERAVKAGLPTTDGMAVIDFLTPQSGMDTATAVARVKAKYSAVSRANNQGSTYAEKAASGASRAMHEATDTPSDSYMDL